MPILPRSIASPWSGTTPTSSSRDLSARATASPAFAWDTWSLRPRWLTSSSRSRIPTTATPSAWWQALPRSRIRIIDCRDSFQGPGHATPSDGSPARPRLHRTGQPGQLRLGDGGLPARETFEQLKECRVLVRLMSYPGYPAGLRISIGTDAEIDRLLQILTRLD